MVIDTSAIVAIVFSEPERDRFSDLIARESVLALSAVTYYEASVVTANKKQDRAAVKLVDELITGFSIEIVACDVEQSMAARNAYFRFGRGWHAAGLNFADCFSYVAAQMRNEPLLFKGGDFLKTDVVPAWRP